MIENYVNKIFNCDCVDILKQLPDKSVDLIVTDPPYGVRSKEEWDNKENFLAQINNWLNECIRISKNNVLWFCADKMIPYILKNREDQFARLLIWNKPKGTQFAGASNNNIWYSMEPILVFGTNGGINKNKDYGFSVFDYRTIPFAEYNHPTVKPLDLMRKLIYFYSNENDIILDPFMGTGTTIIASHQLKRRYIGIEKDKEHFLTAQKRTSKIQKIL